VNLPKGRIEPVTSAATSRKGNRAVFAVLDQTEEWTKSNGGVRLAEVMRINAAKIGGTTIESPNAYTPGTESVAELSAQFYKAILEGRARDDGLLYDHREAPPETDLSDRESLLAGLAHVYGDSADVNGGWVDLDTIIATIWDPGTDVQTSRADFLNQITHASDSWLSSPEWEARKVKVLPKPGELITLGFDGSRERRHSVTDATALVGCRVSDGHLFELGVWEQPDGVDSWRVPVAQVEAAVRSAFLNYKVAAFYADPPKWETHVAQWEAEYGSDLTVKASREHPIEWWTGRPAQMVAALDQFHSAVLNGDLTHSGESALTRHVLNARRRPSRSGIQVAKEFPESPRKIDAAIAAVLAWQARLDVMARPVEKEKTYEAVFA
jgi:phage terminase large subunit-like protein